MIITFIIFLLTSLVYFTGGDWRYVAFLTILSMLQDILKTLKD